MLDRMTGIAFRGHRRRLLRFGNGRSRHRLTLRFRLGLLHHILLRHLFSLRTVHARRLAPAGIARRMQATAATSGMMLDRTPRMTGKIQRRISRRIGPLASLLGTFYISFVDARIKYALALLGAVLLVHRPPDFLALRR